MQNCTAADQRKQRQKEKCMGIVYDERASETIVFAAEELERYLEQMLDGFPKQLEICIETENGSEKALDEFQIQMEENGGRITGNHDRSVLIGVYDYLHTLGCRFLLPGKAGERIPKISPGDLKASYTKRASFRHRGVCIEGADSLENILDFIDWLPKVGYNSFFLQFQVPYAFLARWYHHEENPYREPEPFTREDAKDCMQKLEQEIKRRGLLLHKVGHGWTGEALGYQTASWDFAKAEVTPQTRRFAAVTAGERKLFKGIPADTNLCYHSGEAIETFASLVTDYARKNPKVDYLHIWLADEYNNVCECPDCQATTLSDQYVRLLNEIDRRLTAEHLKTKLVFLLYQELLWPPEKERLRNPERFVLMFAPISRTFEASYSLKEIPEELPEYVRNQVVLPTSLGENLAYLRGWQKIFSGDSFVYDYPLGRAHYGDFGYVHIARLISGDIKKLNDMGLDGYISCQELRAALPNALPNYMMGYTLFQQETDPEDVIREYFQAAYGACWEKIFRYLEQLSALSCCDYMNGKGSRENEAVAGRMEELVKTCRLFSDACQAETANRGRHRSQDQEWRQHPEDLFWELLIYHQGAALRLAQSVFYLAKNERERAFEAWEDLRRYLCQGEAKFQPYVDVYRILEVTQKYTGFRKQLENECRFA